jgi:hypothetical protein
VKLEFLVEGFNVFNRTQVTVVNPTIYNQAGTTLTFNGAGTNPFFNVHRR